MNSPNSTSQEATPEADLSLIEKTWEALAQNDPLWAILSDPAKKGNKWTSEEFFATGVAEIQALVEKLHLHAIEFATGNALDFGCGVGRLTQALSSYFQSVCGVDVAPTMVKMADELNRYAKCRYFLNPHDNLHLFGDGQFTFVYSNIVLQHIFPTLVKKYIAEFSRLLSPGGLLVFQMPARFLQADELPAAAFSAQITVAETRLTVSSGSTISLDFTVENSSHVTWNYSRPNIIALGNHWLDKDGLTLREDDGRVALPPGLPSRERVSVTLAMRAPSEPGSYFLEIDVVQEGVTWFAKRGSIPIRLPVTVTGHETPATVLQTSTGASLSPQPASPPEKASYRGMYCIPRAEILALLRELDLRIEFIEPSGVGGVRTLSYVYYARKR